MLAEERRMAMLQIQGKEVCPAHHEAVAGAERHGITAGGEDLRPAINLPWCKNVREKCPQVIFQPSK